MNMNEMPEALRLADLLNEATAWLDAPFYHKPIAENCNKAAAELRHIHAENEILQEALKWSLKNGVVYYRTYDAHEGFNDAGCGCCSSSIEPPPHLQEMILKIARQEKT